MQGLPLGVHRVHSGLTGCMQGLPNIKRRGCTSRAVGCSPMASWTVFLSPHTQPSLPPKTIPTGKESYGCVGIHQNSLSQLVSTWVLDIYKKGNCFKAFWHTYKFEPYSKFNIHRTWGKSVIVSTVERIDRCTHCICLGGVALKDDPHNVWLLRPHIVLAHQGFPFQIHQIRIEQHRGLRVFMVHLSTRHNGRLVERVHRRVEMEKYH